MAQIDTTAVINAVRFAQQGSNPASPAATYWLAFIKSDGLYLKDSAGNVLGPIRGMANDTLWDAAGDLAIGTGANTGGRLAIGTANQILRVNAGATAPEWVSAGRVLLSEQTPTGTGTVTFSSIPSGYRDLMIYVMGRSTKGASYNDTVRLALNNDTTAANYRYITLAYYQTSHSVGAGDDYIIGDLPAASAIAGSGGSITASILNYSGTTYRKNVHAHYTFRWDASATGMSCGDFEYEWENTAAIDRADVILASGNYDTGTIVRLYGVY